MSHPEDHFESYPFDVGRQPFRRLDAAGRRTGYDTEELPRTEGSFKMRLVLHERNVGPITLLELGERLTIENVPELRDKVQELVIQGRRSFLLDCSRVIAIDSQGIGGLVRNWVSLQSQGAKLKLLNPSVRMREVLEIVGLQKVIGSFDDIEKALRNF